MTPEIAEEIGKSFLKMANKKRNKDSKNNEDDEDDDMDPNIEINIEGILDNDLIISEYLEELSRNFFKLANAMRSKDNEVDSEDNRINGNDNGNDNENNGNDNGNDNDEKLNISSKTLQKIDECKMLLKKNKKYDKYKKYTSEDEVLKKLNARAEDDRKANEALKKILCKRSTKRI